MSAYEDELHTPTININALNIHAFVFIIVVLYDIRFIDCRKGKPICILKFIGKITKKSLNCRKSKATKLEIWL